ncbi:MAG: hypothetical protein PXX83_08070 [Candidatus Nitrosotalea sp.]|nr:hypothetical protein [Candidatus Nitrosotalea sp.]
MLITSLRLGNFSKKKYSSMDDLSKLAHRELTHAKINAKPLEEHVN